MKNKKPATPAGISIKRMDEWDEISAISCFDSEKESVVTKKKESKDDSSILKMSDSLLNDSEQSNDLDNHLVEIKEVRHSQRW